MGVVVVLLLLVEQDKVHCEPVAWISVEWRLVEELVVWITDPIAVVLPHPKEVAWA
jgi:hypothetical protein